MKIFWKFYFAIVNLLFGPRRPRVKGFRIQAARLFYEPGIDAFDGQEVRRHQFISPENLFLHRAGMGS